MFTHFNEKEKSVHYSPDRNLSIAFKPSVFLFVAAGLFAILSMAWIQYLLLGLPPDPSLDLPVITETSVKGFPIWVILCHWVNFFFLVILIRRGLSIPMDHPRLYWNNGSKPGSEWVKFIKKKVSDKELWTAKDDARYLIPVIGLPGYRHTIGIARSWHFIHVPFFVINGLIFVSLLFAADQWGRVVRSSWHIIPDARSIHFLVMLGYNGWFVFANFESNHSHF